MSQTFHSACFRIIFINSFVIILYLIFPISYANPIFPNKHLNNFNPNIQNHFNENSYIQPGPQKESAGPDTDTNADEVWYYTMILLNI